MIETRKIDHHAYIRITHHSLHITPARWWIVATKDHNIRKRFQCGIISLRIDNAKAIFIQDELLADESGNPRLLRARITGDKDIVTADHSFDWFVFSGMPEQYVPRVHTFRGQLSLPGDATAVVSNRFRPRALQNVVRDFLQ